tara:strand:- start:3968 stop:4816 length:849 start_codon:yes stop_codon:yes gene_type:complete
MKIIFIADFFVDEVPGGGELNNEELISLFNNTKNYYNEIAKIKSSDVSLNFIKENLNCSFIVSNFINLHPECKDLLEKECHYVIYEHDHKYLINRNPARFKDFLAPKEAIVNYDFYKNAKAVFCQSSFHSEIVKKNLNLDNIISLGGNLWDTSTLEKMIDFAKKDKRETCSIMNSPISHKNPIGAVNYCKKQNLNFELINPCTYYEFLDKISNNDTFVFFPQTPETLSRVVVEARMMNMKVITNSLVGASGEDWFKLKGEPLISFFQNKREEILRTVGDYLK